MRITKTFTKLARAAAALGVKFIDSRGGTRSGKTYSVLQLLIAFALSDRRPTVTSVVSRALPHLKQGAIRDFKKILIEEGVWEEKRWNATECFYTFANGAVIEFFGVEATGKVFGPGRDRLFMNEANFIKKDTADQLIARTRGLVIYDYNPAAPFWGTRDLPERCEKDPSLHMEHVHSTYVDNQYLDKSQVAFIESFRGDNNYWRVYGLGLMGQIQGQIYDFQIVDKMPDPAGLKEVWGLDFGYTNDVSALVRVLLDTGKRKAYVDERLYRRGIQTPELAQFLKQEGIRPVGYGPTVYADNSRGDTIDELVSYGLNVVRCSKAGTVASQVQYMTSWTICVTRRSVNVQDEGVKYMYKQDANGDFTNEPVDAFNHACDAMRYAVYTSEAKVTPDIIVSFPD